MINKFDSFNNNAITGFRAIAVLLVFNVHAMHRIADYYSNKDYSSNFYIFKLLTFGHLGVDMFFVLSGFLIYYTIKKNNYSLPKFLQKRLLRVTPVVIVLTIPLIGKYINPQGIPIIFDNIIFLDLFNSKNLNTVTWSLEYEMYFYIIMGVILIVFNINSILSVLLMSIVLYIINLSFVELDPIVQMSRFNTFFLGVILGIIYFDDSKWLKYNRYFKAWWLYIIMFMFAFYLWKFYIDIIVSNIFLKDIYYLYVGITCFLLLGSILMDSNLLIKVLEKKFFIFIGTISYSFYLFHYKFGIPYGIKLIEYLQLDKSPFLLIMNYFLSLLITIVASIFLYKYFEKPYFKLKKYSNDK